MEKGRAEGLAEGEARGKAEGILMTASRFLALGIDIQTIAKATGLTNDQILNLQQPSPATT